MPPYLYAVASALLWAATVPILNIGIARLPRPLVSAALSGLLVSLSCGTIVLGMVAWPVHATSAISLGTIAAGVFTYPLGTGLYYFASFAFGGRTEFAAQFAKVKPLFSASIAIGLLGEALVPVETIALLLMVAGVLSFFVGTSRHSYSFPAVVLGLATALSWAIGETLVKLSFGDSTSTDQAFVALASGTVVAYLGYLVARLFLLKPVSMQLHWLWPFAIHGVVSFGLAYTLFFHSISTLGFVPSVLINAFWPFLSIVITRVLASTQKRSEMQAIPIPVWLASGLLLLASLTEIVATHW